MATPKRPGWGGKRPNQTGRPKKLTGPRQNTGAMIKPWVKRWLQKEVERRGAKSESALVGDIIERAALDSGARPADFMTSSELESLRREQARIAELLSPSS